MPNSQWRQWYAARMSVAQGGPCPNAFRGPSSAIAPPAWETIARNLNVPASFPAFFKQTALTGYWHCLCFGVTANPSTALNMHPIYTVGQIEGHVYTGEGQTCNVLAWLQVSFPLPAMPGWLAMASYAALALAHT